MKAILIGVTIGFAILVALTKLGIQPTDARWAALALGALVGLGS